MVTVSAVRTGSSSYPTLPPFHPSQAYPEYPFGDAISTEPNHAYAGVRDALAALGLDAARFGTSSWNPLRDLLAPGMTVVLKPNFVLSRHSGGGDLFSIVTHPSILRAVADYCWIALGGRGRIVVADAPQYDCDFGELMQATRLDEVSAFFGSRRGARLEILDLRSYWSRRKHFASQLLPLPGDPAGSVRIDLRDGSALSGKAGADRLYGAVYRRQETIRHHSAGRHEYELSNTILSADAVISVPKLKVHKKVGVTLNAKGLVGVATNKNFLVHYTLTPPSEGGDQYPDGLLTPVEERLIRTERWMYDHLLASGSRWREYCHRAVYGFHNNLTKRLGLKVDPRKRQLDAGNWYGNDSAWRMTLDLLRAFLYADANGSMQSTPQRKVFSVVDGIVGGERNGPLAPSARPSGVVLAGENLLAVDLVATRLMGFDPLRLRLYEQALADPQLGSGLHPITNIRVATPEQAWRQCLTDPTARFLGFEPHPGWIGHVEPAGHAA